MNYTKYLTIILCLSTLYTVTPVNANPEDFIVPYNTPNTATPDLVYCWHTQDGVSEMEFMVSSQEFQDYLQRDGINKDDYELKLISPYSDEPNKIMVHNTTHKWYYIIKNTENSPHPEKQRS